MNRKRDFTLAESATHRGKCTGFTLAEVLITLAIIGVVAAMTIPTLIAKINEKVTENQKKVFEAKVLKGLNLTRTHGDLNNTYSSTYDFLQNGLGKHLKMAKICDASHTRDCVPYDTVIYSPDGTKEETADVKDINTAEKLGKTEEDGFKDMASFVMGDGTVVIATYKLDCLVDEGKLDKDLGENECFAGVYDLNGTRKPNKMGKDLLGFNNATLKIKKVPVVLATLGGVKIISNAEVPTTPLTHEDCEANKSTYGISSCLSGDSDYWGGAMKACQEAGGRLPTRQELVNMARELYNNTSISEYERVVTPLDTTKIPAALSGMGSSWHSLLSSSANTFYAYSYSFDSWGTNGISSVNRSDLGSYHKAVCVMD